MQVHCQLVTTSFIGLRSYGKLYFVFIFIKRHFFIYYALEHTFSRCIDNQREIVLISDKYSQN